MSDSGVWVFNNDVIGLVDGSENPEAGETNNTKQKVLVHIPNNEVITSYSLLEQHLLALGWVRHLEDHTLIQFRKGFSLDLISLPRDFSKFKSIYMYDIVNKNPDKFEVKDA